MKKRNAHVPEGKEPCDWCCRGGCCDVAPGYFRDFDVDFGAGRYGVCCGCGGTGILDALKDQEGDRLMKLRFLRDSLTNKRDKLLREDATEAGAQEIIQLTERLAGVLPEELELLRLVKEIWERAGRPSGVYAERLVKELEGLEEKK